MSQSNFFGTTRVLLFLFVFQAISAQAWTFGGVWGDIKSSLTGVMVTDAYLKKNTTAQLSYKKAFLIQHNDTAFLSKIDAIQSATQSIDLIYYIYADDESSSYMSTQLVKKAKEGVKVRLLLDYFRNYSQLDMFTMMEREGGKGSDGQNNLQVRFYNRPTLAVLRAADYLTTGCQTLSSAVTLGNTLGITTCTQAKVELVTQRYMGEPANTNKTTPLASMLLSGVYAKNGFTMQAVLDAASLVDAEELESLRQSSGDAISEQQKESLKKVLKLYFEVKTGPSIAKRLQLGVALALHGGQINPIFDAVETFLPVAIEHTPSEIEDLDHFTDFTHHKLLLVDPDKPLSRLLIGGRNVENSYHMGRSPLNNKYIFSDTGLDFELSSGASHVQASFNMLWGFDRLVASTQDIRIHAPNDFVAAARWAGKACKSAAEPKTCMAGKVAARQALTISQREDELKVELAEKADLYKSHMPSFHYMAEVRSDDSTISVVDLEKGGIVSLAPSVCSDGSDCETGTYYLENLPFVLKFNSETPKRELDAISPPNLEDRIYGSANNLELENGKYIHATWVRSLREVCLQSRKQKAAKTVVIHQGYFAPTSSILFELAKMLSGERGCPLVTVKVFTNSIESTDLNSINLLARSQMVALRNYIKKENNSRDAAQLEYYEQVKDGTSIHTKVMVFDQDVYVGSANAEPRSLVMDTNNGAFFRRDNNLLNYYLKLTEEMENSDKFKLMSATHRSDLDVEKDSFDMSFSEMREAHKASANQIAAQFGVDQRLDAEQYAKLQTNVLDLLDKAYKQTSIYLQDPGSRGQGRASPQGLTGNNIFDTIFQTF